MTEREDLIEAHRQVDGEEEERMSGWRWLPFMVIAFMAGVFLDNWWPLFIKALTATVCVG